MSDIQWSDGAPIYRQLKERVIAMMLDGILKPGDALPSVRRWPPTINSTPSPFRAPTRNWLTKAGGEAPRPGHVHDRAGGYAAAKQRARPFPQRRMAGGPERIQRTGLSLDELLPQGKV